jgi:hypothetical protein
MAVDAPVLRTTTVVLSARDVDRLRELARAEDRSVSAVVRRLVSAHLEAATLPRPEDQAA